MELDKPQRDLKTYAKRKSFTLIFPQYVPDETAFVIQEVEPKQDVVVKNDGVILLVEDEEGVRRVAKMSLELFGYDVIEASNGNAAVDLIAHHSETAIDVLVTDLVMPGMTGQALAAKLSDQFPRMQVLFISGYGDVELAKSLNEGVKSFFLQKPFSANRLVAAVDQAIAGKSLAEIS